MEKCVIFIKFLTSNLSPGFLQILMGGRHIFMGYLNDPDQTAGALDTEGFLGTGDIGQVDKFGFVYITGRLKVYDAWISLLTSNWLQYFSQELLITAGGETVAPVLVEDNIKAELPCVSQAMVVGDRRKFLAVLLTLKVSCCCLFTIVYLHVWISLKNGKRHCR